MKYESNKPMYSKDIAQKPFFIRRSRAITLIIIGVFLSVIELDLYFMIIYLYMKYQSNTPMSSKDIARKPFSVLKGQDVRDVRMYVRTDVRTSVMLYAPPPLINGGGIKK